MQFVSDPDPNNKLTLSTDVGVPYSALTQSARNARRAPFLAGALVGAGVANHRYPTYYTSSYYYPSTYYPSSGYYNNGYYYG